MIAYVFAMRHESALLEKNLRNPRLELIEGVRCLVGELGSPKQSQRVVVATVGMGPERAAHGAQMLIGHYPLRLIVNGGYAGALAPQLKRGRIVVANNYTHEDLLAFLRLLPEFDFANFYTTTEFIGDPARKQELAGRLQVQTVDMETAALAEVAQAGGIPFTSVRVISDEIGDKIPPAAVLAGADITTGKATPMRFLMHLLLYPHHIPPAIRFIRGLAAARTRLTEFLLQLHEELPVFDS